MRVGPDDSVGDILAFPEIDFESQTVNAADVEIDGEIVPADDRRRAGLCPNPVMLIDPKLGDVCLTDPIGGSASFYDTAVAVVPA